MGGLEDKLDVFTAATFIAGLKNTSRLTTRRLNISARKCLRRASSWVLKVKSSLLPSISI